LFSDGPWMKEFSQKPSVLFVKNAEKFSSNSLFEEILPRLNTISAKFGNPKVNTAWAIALTSGIKEHCDSGKKC